MKTLIERFVAHARGLAYISLFGALATATFSNSLFEISSSIFIGLWIVDLLAHRRPGVFRGVWPVLLGVYVAVNFLSLIPAGFAFPAVKGAFRTVRWAILALAVTDIIDTREKFHRAIQAIVAVAVFVAVDALTQGATGVEILRNRQLTAFYGETGRVTGPFPHANDFSAYLCLAVLACASALAAALGEKARGRAAWCALALVLSAASLALTYSRGAWLAVVAALLLCAVLRRSIWPLVVIALFAGGAYLQSPFLFQHRLGSVQKLFGGTVAERRVLWSESLQMIAEKPMLGFGVNTYSKNVDRFKDASKQTDRQYAHNGYLQIGAETGLLGLGAFLAVILFFMGSTLPVFFARRAGETVLSAQGLWLGLAAFLLQSATDTTLQSLLLLGLFWMWIGLSWAAYRLLRKDA